MSVLYEKNNDQGINQRTDASGCRRIRTNSDDFGANHCCSRRVMSTWLGECSTNTFLFGFQKRRHSAYTVRALSALAVLQG